MEVKCPECGSNAEHKQVRQHDTPYLLYIAGGVVFTLLYLLSRETRFECSNCGARFFSHANTSRVFRVVWFLVSVAFLLVVGFLIVNSLRPK